MPVYVSMLVGGKKEGSISIDTVDFVPGVYNIYGISISR